MSDRGLFQINTKTWTHNKENAMTKYEEVSVNISEVVPGDRIPGTDTKIVDIARTSTGDYVFLYDLSRHPSRSAAMYAGTTVTVKRAVPEPTFNVGDRVYINSGASRGWLKGTITGVGGTGDYSVRADGETFDWGIVFKYEVKELPPEEDTVTVTLQRADVLKYIEHFEHPYKRTGIATKIRDACKEALG
jgi:hypothetical protein